MVKGNKSKIDNLGRVVIPKSIRKALNVEHNDEISMHVENQALIITKFTMILKKLLICLTKDGRLTLFQK